MKKILTILSLIFLTTACRNNDSPLDVLKTEDPDWIRLEIPAGREAYAIVGDIDKTLLVTTWTKAFYSIDRGRTWQESKDFQGPILGLFVHNDTIFSLASSGQDEDGNLRAGLSQYFTPNYGLSWTYNAMHYSSAAGYKFYSDLQMPIGVVQASDDVSYYIKQTYEPVSPGLTTFYTQPSELLKKDSFGVRPVRLPFKHKLINLYLDSENRLYVAASGGTFNEANNHVCCASDAPAVVYVSRKPLP